MAGKKYVDPQLWEGEYDPVIYQFTSANRGGRKDDFVSFILQPLTCGAINPYKYSAFSGSDEIFG